MENKMKVYKVYLEIGEDDVIVAYVPAYTEEQAKDYCAGNGEIVAVKEVTDYKPRNINEIEGIIANALKAHSIPQFDIDVITRALSQTGILG